MSKLQSDCVSTYWSLLSSKGYPLKGLYTVSPAHWQHCVLTSSAYCLEKGVSQQTVVLPPLPSQSKQLS